MSQLSRGGCDSILLMWSRLAADRIEIHDTAKARSVMKALKFHGAGKYSWEETQDPALAEATDAVVRIDRTTICGTDLHILKGDVPTVEPGRTLGHEGVGTVVRVGEAVRQFAVGDRVLISCIT